MCDFFSDITFACRDFPVCHFEVVFKMEKSCVLSTAIFPGLLILHFFSVLLSIYSSVELLGHIVILCLTYLETSRLFFTVSIFHYHRPYTRVLVSPHHHQHLLFFIFFNSSFPRRCEVMSCCSFWFASPL